MKVWTKNNLTASACVEKYFLHPCTVIHVYYTSVPDRSATSFSVEVSSIYNAFMEDFESFHIMIHVSSTDS